MQAGHGKVDHQRVACCCNRSIVALRLLLAIPFFCLILFNGIGCSRLQLPAIDPYGSRIFLPLTNTTQLDLPRLHSTPEHAGIIPQPAFTTPPTPPPCVDAGAGGMCSLLDGKHQLLNKLSSHFDSPGKAGEILLTPLRVVAPVNGEVVLLAGICGKDGYLVKRQPLEWMLSPDSVGTFIEVGDDQPGKLTSLLRHKDPKIEKLDVDFARGRTSYKETLITRGSPSRDDDIQLREGQTWLSISSPSEGVSRVTVLAPDSEIWDRRRQTATIYWVDAQASFPQPQIVRSGTSVQLVTRVTKAENLVPAEGWIVRYTILDPSIAQFVPGDPTTIFANNTATVRVNRDGQAIVTLASPPGSRGTTPVIVDVIRPEQPSDNLPEIPIRREQTFVTFSAPGLVLETFGPEIGSVGEQLTYVASLANPGDIDAENVRLMMTTPIGTKILSATPQPSNSTNGGLIWEQGVLAANRQLDVSIVLETLQANTFDVLFQAEGSGGLSDRKSVRTQIIEASVEATFQPAGGVAQAEIGKLVQYEIYVKNTGRQTLTDLTLLIETDPGLPEAYQGENRVEQVISRLEPGESRPVDIAFQVQQEGQLNARLQVRSGDNLLAEKTTSIRGLPEKPKRPEIGVNIDFPETIRVGTNNKAVITVRNPGDVKLSSIKVMIAIDPSLVARFVDRDNMSRFTLSDNGATATWSAQDLLARTSVDSGDFVRQLVVEFESRAVVAQGRLSVRASAAEGVEAEDSTDFRATGNDVLPQDGSSPPTLPSESPSSNATRSGNLRLTLSDFGDPTIVGKELRYGMVLANDQNVPDRNVRLMIKVPPGVRFIAITSNGTRVAYQFGESNTIILPNVQFLRAGEQVEFIFVVIPDAQAPRLMEIQAQTYSDGRPEPVNASEQTTVNLN